MRKIRGWRQLATQVGLAIVGLFVVLPIWNMAAMAFDGALPGPPEEVRLLPRQPTLNVFVDLWQTGPQSLPFAGLLRNSLIVSGGAALLSLVLGVSMAYAFSRMRFPGRRSGLLALLVGTLLPPIALMTPLWVLLRAVHLANSQLGLVIVYASLSMPLCVWLMRSAFLAVPRDLDEAVFVEGGNAWHAFRHVGLPNAAPAIAVAVLFAFLVGYSEFALGWLFVDRGDMVTLAMAMAGSDIGLGSRDWAHQAALTLMMAVPVLALFLVLQRRLLADVRLGIDAQT